MLLPTQATRMMRAMLESGADPREAVYALVGAAEDAPSCSDARHDLIAAATAVVRANRERTAELAPDPDVDLLAEFDLDTLDVPAV